MAGIQFLGTMPRQPGAGEQLGAAVAIGTDAFLRQRANLQDLQFKKEEMGLRQKEVGLKEKTLEMESKTQMQTALLTAFGNYAKQYELLINSGDEAGAQIAKTQMIQAAQMAEKMLGIPSQALLSQVSTSEAAFNTLREQKLRDSTISSKGHTRDSAMRELTARLVKEGKPVEEVADLVHKELGGGKTKEGAQLFSDIVDYATIVKKGMAQKEADVTQFPEASKLGETIGKNIPKFAGAVSSLSLQPLVTAAKRMRLGIPLPQLDLSRLRGVGAIGRGIGRGFQGE